MAPATGSLPLKRHRAERSHQGLGPVLKQGGIDIAEVVAGPVIAGIVWTTSLATKAGRSLGTLELPRPCAEANPRNTLCGKGRHVRAEASHARGGPLLDGEPAPGKVAQDR